MKIHTSYSVRIQFKKRSNVFLLPFSSNKEGKASFSS